VYISDCVTSDKMYSAYRSKLGQASENMRLKEGHSLSNPDPKLQINSIDSKSGTMRTIKGPPLWKLAQAEERVHKDPDIGNIKANEAKVAKIRKKRLKNEAAEKERNRAKLDELGIQRLKDHKQEMRNLKRLKREREPGLDATKCRYDEALCEYEKDGEDWIVPDDDKEALELHYDGSDPLDAIDGKLKRRGCDSPGDSCDEDKYEWTYKQGFAFEAERKHSLRELLKEPEPSYEGRYANLPVSDSD